MSYLEIYQMINTLFGLFVSVVLVDEHVEVYGDERYVTAVQESYGGTIINKTLYITEDDYEQHIHL